MHEHAHGHDSGHGVSGHGDSGHGDSGHGDSGHGDSGHGDSGRDEHGHGGLGKYIAVFIALCILTAISFGTAHFMMGPEAQGATQLVGRVVMIAVSCCKALLVMLFFMHLIWEANWKYVLTVPASIMSIFLLLMLFPDVLDRTRNYAEERWLYAAQPRLHDQAATPDDPAAAQPEHAPATRPND